MRGISVSIPFIQAGLHLHTFSDTDFEYRMHESQSPLSKRVFIYLPRWCRSRNVGDSSQSPLSKRVFIYTTMIADQDATSASLNPLYPSGSSSTHRGRVVVPSCKKVSIPFIQAGLHLLNEKRRKDRKGGMSQSPLSKRVFIYYVPKDDFFPPGLIGSQSPLSKRVFIYPPAR